MLRAKDGDMDMRFAYAIAALAALAALGAPARAQNSAEADAVLISTDDLQAPYTVLGVVHASVVPDGLLPSFSPRGKLNDDLRAEAAKLGGNAVINTKYSKRTFLDKGPMTAEGKAVRIADAPAETQTANASGPAGSNLTYVPMTSAVPTAPGAAPAPVVGGAPARRAMLTHAVSAGTVILTEQDIPYRTYTIVGDVSSEAHQYGIFTEVQPRDALDDDMRKQAFDMGADAVIKIQYKMGRKMFSTPSTATGKAVKFN